MSQLKNCTLMKILELFSGTGSIGKACDPDDDVISLDIINSPTIKQDILTWDYKVYQPGYFDYIHASPPCTVYSKANTRVCFQDRDFPKGDVFVLKTLEILEYFKPLVWTLENPQTGYLKTRPFMQSLKYRDVDYCRYGCIVRKRTRFWSSDNLDLKFLPKCKHDCKYSQPGPYGNMRHINTNKWGKGNHASRQQQRAVIPHDLCVSIVDHVKDLIKMKNA